MTDRTTRMDTFLAIFERVSNIAATVSIDSASDAALASAILARSKRDWRVFFDVKGDA